VIEAAEDETGVTEANHNGGLITDAPVVVALQRELHQAQMARGSGRTRGDRNPSEKGNA
jgi:hypothetical protein